MAAHATAGVVFAALVWYALVRISLTRELAAQVFDPSAIWWDVALGALVAASAVVFVSPIATLVAGLTTVLGIVVVRLGLAGSTGNPDGPSLGYVLLLGGFDRGILVLAGIWIGAGLVLLLRHGATRAGAAA